uniref:Uncharacterized protein n=1 Tax=Setaria digitata TaxID=48799 RepID=A0A915PEZ1_9BILA
MGNVLKRNHNRASTLQHSLSYGLYKKRSKSLSKSKEAKAMDLEDNKIMEKTDSWTSLVLSAIIMGYFKTIGTLSAFSLSFPTGESDRSADDRSSTSIDSSNYNRSSSNHSRRSTTSEGTSNTSADFSSFKNLSEVSEHTTMRPRADDLEWMKAVRQYHDREPVFRKKPFKAALKTRPRRLLPQLHWRRLYHRWAIRQSPKAYKGMLLILPQENKSVGADVLNPYINRALEDKNDIDLNLSDLARGIFYLKCTNC